MATHDYVIDNSTGANVRADINNVLQAILTNNSSSSAPSTTAAYMWWADTTNGVLKIRNSSNNDWVELLQLDGTLTLEDGSASTPALAFRDDLNTGIFSSAADTFNVATAGVERMELGATTVFNEDGADVDFRIEGDTDANLFHVDAGNDRIGISTSTPDSLFHVFAGSAGSISAAGSAVITLEKNADTALQFLSPSSNNQEIRFGDESDNGSGYILYSHSSNFLSFGLNGGSEKMRIDSSGRLLLGTTTEGHSEGDDLTIATSGVTGMTIRSGTSSAGNIFFSDATSGDAERQGIIRYDHSDDAMKFNVNNAEALRIDSSGRLLIGTTTEGHSNADDLTVNNSANCGITIRSGSSNDGNIFFSDDTSGNGETRGVIKYKHADDALVFNSNGSERMRIDSSGRVLIGTTTEGSSSADNFTVADSSHCGITIRSGSSSGGNLFFTDLSSGDQFQGYVQYNHSTNHLSLGTNKLTRLEIDENGVSTFNQANSSQSSPNLSLLRPNAADNVQNDMIQFECGGQGRGKIVSSSSDGSSPQFSTFSDYRMKENIRDYTQGYDNIKAIPVKIFDMITDGTKDIKGWVAHEVQPYIPEAVMGNKDAVVTQAMVDSGERDESELGNDIMQNLAYGAFMPDVVGALQTAIAKIEVLETEVAALKAA